VENNIKEEPTGCDGSLCGREERQREAGKGREGERDG